jgi:hypothetical protein
MNSFHRAALSWILLLVPALAPTLAQAEDPPGLCTDRPGISTPPCTLPAGRVMAEFGAAEWDHAAAPGTREDTITLADTLARIGLGHSTEVQIGLGGWSHQRSRSKSSVSTVRGLGDAMIGLRHGFGSEDGAKVAAQAFITLPAGRAPNGAGDWGAGLLVPVALSLPSGFGLALTPEIDAAVNGSGHGRHLAWGGVAGLSHGIGKFLSFGAEVSSYRDEDPGGTSTDSRVDLAAAWRAGRAVQFDIEFDLGVSHGAPDHALMLGFARQF